LTDHLPEIEPELRREGTVLFNKSDSARDTEGQPKFRHLRRRSPLAGRKGEERRFRLRARGRGKNPFTAGRGTAAAGRGRDWLDDRTQKRFMPETSKGRGAVRKPTIWEDQSLYPGRKGEGWEHQSCTLMLRGSGEGRT